MEQIGATRLGEYVVANRLIGKPAGPSAAARARTYVRGRLKASEALGAPDATATLAGGRGRDRLGPYCGGIALTDAEPSTLGTRLRVMPDAGPGVLFTEDLPRIRRK